MAGTFSLSEPTIDPPETHLLAVKAIDHVLAPHAKPRVWTTARDLETLSAAWGHWAWEQRLFASTASGLGTWRPYAGAGLGLGDGSPSATKKSMARTHHAPYPPTWNSGESTCTRNGALTTETSHDYSQGGVMPSEACLGTCSVEP